MRRRGPGIQGLQAGRAAQKRYEEVGAAAEAAKAEHVREALATFKAHLEEFAVKHRGEIASDPVFRAQFHRMCQSCGVDPLASSKGYWAQLLGVGDFYFALGVQVVECCLAARNRTGGLMELQELLRAVRRRRGSQAGAVNEDDLMRAIDTLKTLGGGWAVVKAGSRTLVRSVPTELNRDHGILLELAQQEGFVTQGVVVKDAGWTPQRTREGLEQMLNSGLAMVDDQAPGGERRFYFPCLWTAATSSPASAADSVRLADEVFELSMEDNDAEG